MRAISLFGRFPYPYFTGIVYSQAMKWRKYSKYKIVDQNVAFKLM